MSYAQIMSMDLVILRSHFKALFFIFCLLLSSHSSEASDAIVLSCQNNGCDATDSVSLDSCVRFDLQIKQFDNQKWVKVNRSFKGMRDTFYYGRVEQNSNKNDGENDSVFYSEIEHTAKEFSLYIDAKTKQANLNLLISGEPLPESLSKLNCIFN